MQNSLNGLNRRNFLKGLAGGACIAGLGTVSNGFFVPSAFAQSPDLLPFRVGAKPLALHFNENSLGMSAKAWAAAQEAVVELGNRYPTHEIDDLKLALSAKHNVKPSQIILGNGSTEIIGAIVALAVQNKATVIEPTPTFGDLRRRAEANGLNVIKVPVGKGFVTDIEALKKSANATSGPVLVNICNPNNPTGTIVDQGALTQWILSAPERMTFLIDEAYFEYAQQNPNYDSALTLILKGQENVVVTRTFSKIYGMAGLRIGYGIAAPDTATQLDKLATSFNLSMPGIAAALASLKDQAFFEKSLQSNAEGKEVIIETLNSLDLEVIPSNTNFVLHKINSDLASYSKRMLENGIRVGRRMTSDDGWNRLSIGKPDEMRAFSQALLAFRERGWV